MARTSHSPTPSTEGAPEDDATAPSAVPYEGAVVSLSSGEVGQVGRLIGQGGEGVVHEVQVGDCLLALKWYFPRSATQPRREHLTDLVERGTPHSTFLWPQAIATPPPGDRTLVGFGYVMPLRPAEFHGLYDHVAGRVTLSFRATLTIGLELAQSFMRLHNEGLCYRDISFGNVFFDPDTGHVLVCDNDNVGVDGVSEAAVRGTPYFMAPEVMRGDVLPSRNSDLYSLAVMLFYILMVGHPLLGRRETRTDHLDAAALDRLLAQDPLFVYDPHDASNRPDPVEHRAVEFFWSIYPQPLREKLVGSFTAGLHDPQHGRVVDGEWRMLLARARDLLVSCPECGRRSFLHLEESNQKCWGRRAHQLFGESPSCDATIRRPPMLRFERWMIAVGLDTQIFPHHVDMSYDFSQPIASVNRHPTVDVWGLRNDGDGDWLMRHPDGREHPVAPGRSAPLVTGAAIDITCRGITATVVIE